MNEAFVIVLVLLSLAMGVHAGFRLALYVVTSDVTKDGWREVKGNRRIVGHIEHRRMDVWEKRDEDTQKA